MTLYRRRLLCLALALSMIITLIPAATGSHTSSAQAATVRKGITLVDKVNVRYGAGTNEKIIFALPANHVCDILEVKTVQKVRWYRVETIDPSRKNSNKYRGYIHGDFFRELTADEIKQYDKNGTVATPTPKPESKDGSPTPTPTPQPSGKNQDLPAKAGSIGSVTAGGTNLREGPGTGYHSITRLDRNTQVQLLTIPSIRGAGSNTFFKVKYNGTTGYIMSDFISIISGGPENGESTVVTPKPDTSSASTASTSTTTTDSGNATHVRLILTSCHLRTSPGGDYDQDNDLIGVGSELPLDGKAVKQGGYTWYPVKKNNKKYYVRNDCVQLVSNGKTTDTTTTTTTATTTAQPDPTVNPNGIGYVQTIVGGCNLRATISGTVIKQIAKNVTLPYLLEPVKKNGYTWYFVQDGANRGYLRGDIVKVVKAPSVTPAPADSTTVSQPAEDTPTGYVKTTAAGVNLRKKAGYTDVIGRVDKNVVLPYYGSPSKVKGVTWYNVKHSSLGKGWLHADFLVLCNADGTVIATPEPEPGTVNPSPSGTQTEASYTTLKTGSTGTAVKNLVTELKNQGYFKGTITNKYTTAVANAVKAFQKAKGLTVDGIAGSATQHKLFGTVPIGAADTSNLTMTLYPAEKIDWYTGGINELWAKGSNYKVYDVKTGIVWWAHRWSGGLHVDAEPLTAADTARLCKCYGVTTSAQITNETHWRRRPLLITIGSRTFAASLYGVPHNYPEGDTISTNEFRGQLCIHFTNSKTHDSRKVDSGHMEAIEYAWQHAPNGHK